MAKEQPINTNVADLNKLTAKIGVSQEQVQQAVCRWLHDTHNIDVKPEQLEASYENFGDQHEPDMRFTGFSVTLPVSSLPVAKKK